MDRREMERYLELAVDCCEDWQPVKYWKSTEVNMIWFTNKQLREFIKRIRAEATKEQE